MGRGSVFLSFVLMALRFFTAAFLVDPAPSWSSGWPQSPSPPDGAQRIRSGRVSSPAFCWALAPHWPLGRAA